MRQVPLFIDGKFVKTFAMSQKKLSLKERIENAKRARRDARLVQILTR